jgi:hypothetical protein
MPKKLSDNDFAETEIAPTETLRDIQRSLGINTTTYDGSKNEKYYSHPKVKRFIDALHHLHSVGVQHNIYAGEQLVLLVNNFGWMWDTIPFGRFKDCIEFFCNVDKRKILDEPHSTQVNPEFKKTDTPYYVE